MGMENPFQIFPEEIWEIILEKCESSNEIAAVLEAVPQLKLLARRKQFSWLIDSLFPLILPKYIGFQDAKTCRLVSKRWKNGVDQSLETHTDLVPYGCNELEAISETHFNYSRLPNFTTNIFPFMRFDCEFTEDETWDVPKSNTVQHSGKHTNVLFPGRTTCINLNHVYAHYAKMEFDKKIGTYSEQCRSIPFRVRIGEKPRWQILSTLKSAGHHIWYVSFKLPPCCYWKEELPITELMMCLVMCLSHLPNLKSLKVEAFGPVYGDVSDIVSKNIIAALSDYRIPAPLQTLDLRNFGGACIPRELFNSFLALFVDHTQVKKLTICTCHWGKDLQNMFPGLTDLCLDCTSPSKEFPLKTILKGLTSFPCLRKLSVMGYEINITEIIQFISVQEIESLEVSGEVFVESPAEEYSLQKFIVSKITKMLWTEEAVETFTNAPSVHIMKIKAMPNMNFKFLSMLPSLEFLYVTVNDTSIFNFQNDDENTRDTISVCLYKICTNNLNTRECFKILWEEFPQLNMVTVETTVNLHKCVRENPTRIYVTAL